MIHKISHRDQHGCGKTPTKATSHNCLITPQEILFSESIEKKLEKCGGGGCTSQEGRAEGTFGKLL